MDPMITWQARSYRNREKYHPFEIMRINIFDYNVKLRNSIISTNAIFLFLSITKT